MEYLTTKEIQVLLDILGEVQVKGIPSARLVVALSEKLTTMLQASKEIDAVVEGEKEPAK